MSLRGSDAYATVLQKATWSHANGRSVFHISQSDIDAARLFCYGFRSLAIGAFHAARAALEHAEKQSKSDVRRAQVLLEQLETRAIDPIPRDSRCVISTFYYYDQWISQVIEILEDLANAGLESICDKFLANVEPVVSGNGIYLARDLELREQSAFVVPNLGISIASLIYGDHHSWNAAFLSGAHSSVSVHRHKKGAEIHLGVSPVKGRTILGSCEAEVEEGYAMSIPPMTDHGFVNTSGHEHVLPFIFGSLPMAGWGLFFDVEPRPTEVKRKQQPLDSADMNHSIFLDRSIREASDSAKTSRKVLIPPYRAGSHEVGGLELAVTTVGQRGIALCSPHYRIVSVQRGHGRVRIGQAESEVKEHDHFGVPAEIDCHLLSSGNDPLVILDSMILPVEASAR